MAVTEAVPSERPSRASRPALDASVPTKLASGPAQALVPDVQRHLAAWQLDVAPVPRSAPDESRLAGIEATGLPVRLRIFIEPDGVVSQVEVLHAAQADDDFARAVQAVVLATAYVPGRRAGTDVAAYLDVEVVPEHSPASVIGIGL